MSAQVVTINICHVIYERSFNDINIQDSNKKVYHNIENDIYYVVERIIKFQGSRAKSYVNVKDRTSAVAGVKTPKLFYMFG